MISRSIRVRYGSSSRFSFSSPLIISITVLPPICTLPHALPTDQTHQNESDYTTGENPNIPRVISNLMPDIIGRSAKLAIERA